MADPGGNGFIRDLKAAVRPKGLQTIIEVMDERFKGLEAKMEAHKEFEDATHTNILRELVEIKVQTTETNGRVRKLEFKEKLNAIVRRVLYVLTGIILYAVLMKLLAGIDLGV